MSTTRIDDLKFEIDGDHIDLEQDAGVGEVDRVRLHRIHLQHLASECGLLAPDRGAERTITALQRRLVTLADAIKNLADWVRSKPEDKSSDQEDFPDFLMVTALERLAFALVDDLPRREGLDLTPSTNLVGAGNQIGCSEGPAGSPATSETPHQEHRPTAPRGQLDLLAPKASPKPPFGGGSGAGCSTSHEPSQGGKP